jgi:signal transduction histidine kinase
VEERVLVWALGRDGLLTSDFLTTAGFGCRPCRTVEELCREAGAGTGAVIIAAELLSPDVLACLIEVVDRQPAWSDLPVVVVTGSGAAAGSGVPSPFAALGNVSFLGRPLSLDTLISTVRTALRARRRQYQMRDLLRRLEDADRRKDEFLAMLAHELRNPLAPIRNAVEIMNLVDGLPPPLRRARDVVDRQVEQVVRLVNDLLDVSRITRGKVELHKERVDLRAVVRQAVETSQPLIEAGRHQLALDLPDRPVVVHGDPFRLTQVTSNLLNNAAKYTDEGGRVCVRVGPDGRDAVVRVADTGIGIRPDDLPLVFDLFTQVGTPGHRSQGGLGIGLGLVKRLVEMHGGTVEARSEGLGHGSEFVVRLPLAEVSEPTR